MRRLKFLCLNLFNTREEIVKIVRGEIINHRLDAFTVIQGVNYKDTFSHLYCLIRNLRTGRYKLLQQMPVVDYSIDKRCYVMSHTYKSLGEFDSREQAVAYFAEKTPFTDIYEFVANFGKGI